MLKLTLGTPLRHPTPQSEPNCSGNRLTEQARIQQAIDRASVAEDAAAEMSLVVRLKLPTHPSETFTL